MAIGVNLALRNEAQLEAFIAQVSDRKSPNYGRYLTPDQFAATYGPTQTQVQQVIDHLQASGFSVGSVSSNRTIVEATGPVSAVEAAFGVTISDWHDRDQNGGFFGNDSQPTLPAAIASYVVGVAGLNNHYPLRRLAPAPRVGGGPAGGYTPNDLKKAYDVTPLASAGYNGSGQPLGLFELDGFRQSNITTYDTQYALGSPAPTRVLINGGPGPLGGGEIEVELDIEVMHAMAPASPITVWEGPNSDPGANATYNAIVTSNTTKSNSTSWGICEPNTTSAEMTTLDNIFKQAAAQGQSFFAASGDNGAYDCGDSRLTVDSPANDPYVTGTGGTNLALHADGTYQSESAWSDAIRGIGSGGGPSSYFARPSWQTGPGVANADSNGKRQVPDISSDADPNTGYSVYITNGGTGWTVVGGTSAAAPSWAAFTGVYDQYAAARGKPNLGYANPTLYSAGSNAQAYPPYHDVTTGDNLFYPATPNWDYATGWGSFDGNNLALDLAGSLLLTSVQASNITANSAVITWLTNNSANSRVDYGATTVYGSSVTDGSNVTSHSLTLSGLTNNTSYHFKASSTDVSGQTATSADFTLTTLTNLLLNGGFEARSASWTMVTQATIDSNPADAHSGNNSLQLVATGPYQLTGQTVAVTSGKTYNFSAFGRSSNSGGLWVLESHEGSGAVSDLVRLPFAGSGGWIGVASTYKPAPNVVSVIVYADNTATGTFWFDDASLTPTMNLLTNGGFEAGTAGWNAAPQATIDSNPSDAHAGNNSLELLATGPYQLTGQTVAITPGQSYSFSAFGRSNNPGGLWVLESHDASGAALSDLVRLPFAGNGSWIGVAATYKPAPNVVSVILYADNTAVGTFWFDDASLTPTANLLTNGGFEAGSAGWSLANQATIDSTPADAHAGNNSLRLVATGPYQLSGQAVAVTPGQSYSFSAFGRSSNAGGVFVLESHDASGATFSDLVRLPFAGNGSWIGVAATYKPAANVVSVIVYADNTAAGTFSFDDLNLTPTTNLLANGGFELGMAGWSPASQASIDSTSADAHAGSNSLQLVATGPYQLTSQTVSVSPSQTYSFSAFGRSSNAGGVFVLESHDASGAALSDLVRLPFAGNGSWIGVAASYKPAANVAFVIIYADNTGAGTFWFDDASLTQN